MTRGKMALLLDMAHRGLVRVRDLDAEHIPHAYIKRLCDRGMLERVDRGVYRLPDAPVTELHSLAEIAKRVPHSVVCLLSALQAHELTTEAPHAVWILIDRKARVPKIESPKIEVVRASGAARRHGIETLAVEGVPVPITS